MPYSFSSNRRRRRPLPLAVILLSTFVHGETWVITDHAHPVNATASVRVILLDEQQRIEEQLSHGLSADPREAAVSAHKYLASPQGKELQNNLANALQGLTDAWSLGIQKIPAVVVDRRYVVYGEPDVSTALRVIDRARREQR